MNSNYLIRNLKSVFNMYYVTKVLYGVEIILLSHTLERYCVKNDFAL